MHYNAPEYVIDIARRLRKDQTEAEKILWEYLRKHKVEGYKIRRQYPIGKYIVDFYCAKARLAIEVDGEIHKDAHVNEYDKVRQTEIEVMGIQVLRFSNDDIHKRLDLVMKSIKTALEMN